MPRGGRRDSRDLVSIRAAFDLEFVDEQLEVSWFSPPMGGSETLLAAILSEKTILLTSCQLRINLEALTRVSRAARSSYKKNSGVVLLIMCKASRPIMEMWTVKFQNLGGNQAW